MRVIFIGDIVGRPGRQAIRQIVPRWRGEYGPDLVLANGENAAGGAGLTAATAAELLGAGIDLLTTGNHAFHQKDLLTYLPRTERVVRPLNYPPGTPGAGAARIVAGERRTPVVVANALGRLFMAALDCPFRALDELLATGVGDDGPQVVIVDFHAEATAEKLAMGYYLDGRVSLVVGTHTHVPTADAQVLPGGTGYVTDLGMTGPARSVIGMTPGSVIARFVSGLHSRYTIAEGPVAVNAVLAEIDEESGHTVSIRRLDTVVEVETTAALTTSRSR
jgi:metallophosphoesterase (TIGR00282 family)